jgi:quinol monooxygenase YgiN
VNCLIIVEFPAKPGKLEELKELVNVSLPGLRAFDGCISVEVFQEVETNTLVLVEYFESLDHYNAYLQWAIGNGIEEKLEPILEGGAAGLRVRRFGGALS